MGNFNHLPAEISLDIITRLPTESILDCKLVCKPWRNLISHHPLFYQMYVSRLNQYSVDDESEGNLSFLVTDKNQNLCYFQFNDNHDHETAPVYSVRRMKLTTPITFASREFIGSFNGLVCLYGFEDHTSVAYCVCNLVTREYVVLPYSGDLYVHYSSGFGYLPVTNEYKVVQVYSSRSDPDVANVAVYTLGSGKGWRNVGWFDIKFGVICDRYGVFVKGSLHWMDKSNHMVFDFDSTEEKFCKHLSPPPKPAGCMWFDHSIGEFGGVLYYARYNVMGGRDLDIWLLEEKSDNLDANEQVEHEPLGWRNFSLVKKNPVAFTKSGGVLCFDDSYLCIYNPTASISKRLVRISTSGQVIPHKNTLVSLQELGEEDIKTMEFAEIKETESG